eukprot:TRINITY_DN7821_c2_g1_i1.p1 TRINITY_DN7821_c2_g1~~TRINITY_DN7821_c2_g1_i1.p1  ORF type:complete len:1906 (+),score=695.33 TRINITY_DN7821_c2_g1_i1:46-5763(+)
MEGGATPDDAAAAAAAPEEVVPLAVFQNTLARSGELQSAAARHADELDTIDTCLLDLHKAHNKQLSRLECMLHVVQEADGPVHEVVTDAVATPDVTYATPPRQCLLTPTDGQEEMPEPGVVGVPVDPMERALAAARAELDASHAAFALEEQFSAEAAARHREIHSFDCHEFRNAFNGLRDDLDQAEALAQAERARRQDAEAQRDAVEEYVRQQEAADRVRYSELLVALTARVERWKSKCAALESRSLRLEVDALKNAAVVESLQQQVDAYARELHAAATGVGTPGRHSHRSLYASPSPPRARREGEDDGYDSTPLRTGTDAINECFVPTDEAERELAALKRAVAERDAQIAALEMRLVNGGDARYCADTDSDEAPPPNEGHASRIPADNSALAQALAAAEAQAADAEARYERLAEMYREADEELAAKDAELEALRHGGGGADDANMFTCLEDAAAALEGRDAKLAEYEALVAELAEREKAALERIQELSGELEKVLAGAVPEGVGSDVQHLDRLEEAEGALRRKDAHISDLEDLEIPELKARIRDLEHDLAARRHEATPQDDPQGTQGTHPDLQPLRDEVVALQTELSTRNLELAELLTERGNHVNAAADAPALQAQIGELQAEAEAKETALREQVAALEATADALRGDLAAAEEAVSHRRSELSSLCEKVAAMEAASQAATASTAARLEVVGQQRDEAVEQRNQAERSVATLVAEADILTAQRDQAERACAMFAAHCADAEAAFHAAEAARQQQTTRLAATDCLEVDLRAAQLEAADKASALAAAEVSIESLAAQLAAAGTAAARAAAERSSAAAALQEETAALVAAAQTERDEARQRMELLEQELPAAVEAARATATAELAAAREAAEAAAAQAEEDRAARISELEALAAEKDALAVDLAAAHDAAAAKVAEADVLQAKLAAMDAATADASAAMQRAEEREAALAEASAELAEAREAVAAAHATRDADASAARQHAEALETEVRMASTELAEAREAAEAAAAARDAATADASTAVQRAEALEKALTEASAELAQVREAAEAQASASATTQDAAGGEELAAMRGERGEALQQELPAAAAARDAAVAETAAARQQAAAVGQQAPTAGDPEAVAVLEAQLVQAEAMCEELSEALHARERELGGYQKRLAALTEERDELAGDRSWQELELKGTTQQLEQSTEEVARQSALITALTQQLHAKEEEGTTHRDDAEARRLYDDLAKVTTALEKTQTELQQAREVIAKQATDLQEAKRGKPASDAPDAPTTEAAVAAQTSLQIGQELKQAQTELKQAREVIAKLTVERAERQQGAAPLTNVRRGSGEKEKEYHVALRKLDKQAGAIEALTAQAASLQQACDAKEDECKDLRRTVEQMEAARVKKASGNAAQDQTVKAQLAEAEGTVAQLRDALAQQQQQQAAPDAGVASDKEAHLQKLKEDIAERDARLQELDAAMAGLHERVAQLAEDNDRKDIVIGDLTSAADTARRLRSAADGMAQRHGAPDAPIAHAFAHMPEHAYPRSASVERDRRPRAPHAELVEQQALRRTVAILEEAVQTKTAEADALRAQLDRVAGPSANDVERSLRKELSNCRKDMMKLGQTHRDLIHETTLLRTAKQQAEGKIAELTERCDRLARAPPPEPAPPAGHEAVNGGGSPPRSEALVRMIQTARQRSDRPRDAKKVVTLAQHLNQIVSKRHMSECEVDDAVLLMLETRLKAWSATDDPAAAPTESTLSPAPQRQQQGQSPLHYLGEGVRDGAGVHRHAVTRSHSGWDTASPEKYARHGGALVPPGETGTNYVAHTVSPRAGGGRRVVNPREGQERTASPNYRRPMSAGPGTRSTVAASRFSSPQPLLSRASVLTSAVLDHGDRDRALLAGYTAANPSPMPARRVSPGRASPRAPVNTLPRRTWR